MCTAIILSRAPPEFVQTYLPELLLEQKKSILKLDMNSNAAMVSTELFSSLLRFWYTATYYQPVSPHSSVSELSIATPPNASPSLSKASSTEFLNIHNEIEQLGIQLGTALLPLHCESVPDSVQLLADLKRMHDDKIATDVTITLISSTADDTPFLISTSPENHTQPIPMATFRAHRFLLAAQSTYFYALFCAQFQEAKSHSVHFTDDLFNESIIDMMLTFFYTDKITVSPLNYDTKKPFSPVQRRLEHSKHALRVIQKAFYSADYLGHSDTLGQALLFEMEIICHHFKCVCPECAVLLPSMLAWSDKHAEVVPKLKRTLILLFSEPIHSLASLWSQRPFALLVSSMVPSSALLGDQTLASVKRQEPLFRARTPKTLVHEIVERTFYNVTKHNAIHVLHSIHLCLSQIRSADPHPSWSRPTLNLVNSLLQYTIDLVCQFFDFYCVEYPILLSCVDGIGAGFSVDFLDFLLRHVIQEGIQAVNAGVIYQVIVRDLVGRQEVVRNMAVDDVLTKARIRCATYIAKNWTKVKSQGGFRTLDKSTMRQLADDINIPYRNLTKPCETEFSNIFSFKPKKSKKIAVTDDKNALLTEVYTRRLSLGNLMTRSSNTNLRAAAKSRPRALSTESVLSGLARYNPPRTTPLENQPLINLLSHETDERRKALEEADITPHPSVPTISTVVEHHRPLLRTSSSFTSLTDQLLPVDCDVVTPPSTASSSTSTLDGTARPSRLKFELPTTPARSKSPSLPHLVHSTDSPYLSPQGTKNRGRRGSKTRKSRWSIGNSNYNSDISDDDEFAALPVLGNKIELLRRPLPTMGTIKYIGPVRFAEGTYIGVELESRCKSLN